MIEFVGVLQHPLLVGIMPFLMPIIVRTGNVCKIKLRPIETISPIAPFVP